MGRVSGADVTHERLESAINLLAKSQYGVFSRAQARASGATKGIIQRRLSSGRWEQLSAEVFRAAGAPASWRQSLMAATLHWGDGTAASHRSSAALVRLVGFDPGPIELTVRRTQRRAGPGIVHRNLLVGADLTVVQGIPSTTLARTLIDIASVCSRDRVEEALDDALRRKLVTVSRIRWRLSALAGRGRPGISVMRNLLDARGDTTVPQSVFETRLLRLMARAGLPRPSLQYRIRDAEGRAAIVDFAFPSEKVAIEADGYQWHTGRIRWQDDLARRNRITALGWRVIHVTWDDLRRRPDAVLETIARALVGGTRR